jgi:hypothetical protein
MTLKADGSITAWGNQNYGGADAPSGSGYTKIYSTAYAFALPEGAFVPPAYEAPHALIEPSARFIQIHLPLLPLKPMGQSQHGATTHRF